MNEDRLPMMKSNSKVQERIVRLKVSLRKRNLKKSGTNSRRPLEGGD